MIRLILLMGLIMGLTVVADARAAKLFTVAEQHGGQVSNPSRFTAIIGYPAQCVAGIRCWQYQKGTRSGNAHYPESWYLHQGGVRIRDHVFHLYVMDPRSGWARHVAQVCAQRCFLDGMGTSSIGRTTPRLQWTPAQWASNAALVVRAVRAAGKRVMANSVGLQSTALITAAGGRGSTESYDVASARQVLGLGRIWVTEIGNCWAKYQAFLRYKGRGDHFACYENGRLPWDTGWLR